MNNIKRFCIGKIVVAILILHLGLGDTALYSLKDNRTSFEEGVKRYQKHDYSGAADQFNGLLKTLEAGEVLLKAKTWFMLGASYEKLGLRLESRNFFKQLKDLLDSKVIDAFPAIEGVKIKGLKVYKKVFNEASETEKARSEKNGNVIEKPAPKRKIRKGGIYVALVAGAAALLIIGLLLLTKKKMKPDPAEPVIWQDIQWMKVPAGEFVMGGETGYSQEPALPLHKVYLDEFYISRFEISYNQFDTFCNETGRQKPRSRFGRYEKPVAYITWDDANDFCQWLSNKYGETIKLPTEAQWEKAARGTDQRIYPWGNEEPNCDIVNFAECKKITVAVGTLPAGASPYGVENMSGNVNEYCRDFYQVDYYSQSPYINPTGPATAEGHVVRGGYFNDERGVKLKTFFRQGDLFNNLYLLSYTGFRIIK